jgi:hypothetical protein
MGGNWDEDPEGSGRQQAHRASGHRYLPSVWLQLSDRNRSYSGSRKSSESHGHHPIVRPALDVMAQAAKQCRGPDRPLPRLSLGD